MIAKEIRWSWIKLMKDFFNRLEIKKIRKSAGGSDLILTFLQMQLLSVNTKGNEGFIAYRNLAGSLEDEIADELNTTSEMVYQTIEAFTRCHWIDRVVKDNITIGLNVYELELGSNTSAQDRAQKLKVRKCLIENANQLDNGLYQIIQKSIDLGKIKEPKSLENLIQKYVKKSPLLEADKGVKILDEPRARERIRERGRERIRTTTTEEKREDEKIVEVVEDFSKLKKAFQEAGMDLKDDMLNNFLVNFSVEQILTQLKNFMFTQRTSVKPIQNPLGWIFVACKRNYPQLDAVTIRSPSVSENTKVITIDEKQQLEVLRSELESTYHLAQDHTTSQNKNQVFDKEKARSEGHGITVQR